MGQDMDFCGKILYSFCKVMHHIFKDVLDKKGSQFTNYTKKMYLIVNFYINKP